MKISVIIPTHNRLHLLPEAIASALGQSLRPQEVIVVNNGVMPLPEDALPPEVQIIELPPNIGVSAARNRGAQAAKSDHISFLDDDDLWHPDFLHHLSAALTQENADCAIADLCTQQEDGSLQTYLSISNALPHLKQTILNKNPGFGGGNFLIKKQIFFKAGAFDENIHMAEDQALAVELIFNNFHLIAAPKAKYIQRDVAPTRLSHKALENYMQFYHHCKKYMSCWQKAKFLSKVFKKRLGHKIHLCIQALFPHEFKKSER